MTWVKHTAPDVTWAAETHANGSLADLERLEAIAPHRCSRCFGPYGLSAIKCPNDKGGA